MKKRNSMILLLIILIFAASYFYYTNSDHILSASKTLNRVESHMTQGVVDIEKGLALLQTNQISIDEFKEESALFFHPYYRDTYLQGLESSYKAGKAIALSTQLPLYENISKVYTSRDETIKYIYVKAQEKNATDQTVKLYTFKKEDGDWDIISVKNYVISSKKSSGFDDSSIEYQSIKILE